MTRARTLACRLCGRSAAWYADQTVLHRHRAGYYRCATCDLMQTEQPFWLEEAYDAALTRLDTGAIARALQSAKLTRALCTAIGINHASPCLDTGGGHGVFARLMRDSGYDFFWHDRFAQNCFARGFEGNPRQAHRLATCFEVWEHLTDVHDDLAKMFYAEHDYLLVSTFLHRGHRERWWYYAVEGGQHVAFFSRQTMAWIGRQFGYQPIVGQRYTLFCRRPDQLGVVRRQVVRRLLTDAPASGQSWLSAAVRAIGPRYEPRVWQDHCTLRAAPVAA